MNDQTSKSATGRGSKEAPRRLQRCRSAEKGKRRVPATHLPPYGGRPAPRLCDSMSAFDLAAYYFQVEMIRDRLVGQLPLDGEPFTAAQRRYLTASCRFLKAACTSMNRLMRAYNEPRENEVRKREERRNPRR